MLRFKGTLNTKLNNNFFYEYLIKLEAGLY